MSLEWSLPGDRTRTDPGPSLIGPLAPGVTVSAGAVRHAGGAGVPAAPGRPRVLLVEDDEVNRDVTLLLLSRLGHRADVAENGREALAAVHELAYDVVLMDIQMPEMDGMEATRRIRTEVAAVRQPTIIAVTATLTAEDRLHYERTGMDDCLAKPIRVEELSAVMGEWRPRPLYAVGSVPGQPPDGTVRPEPEPTGPPEPDAASGGEPAVFDPTVLDQLIADLGAAGKELRRDLLETYLHQSDDTLAALDEAGREGDGKALSFTAHSLKSASASLGLLAMSSAAAAFESAFRLAPGEVDIDREAQGLIAEYRRATTALTVELGDEGGEGPTPGG